MQTMNEQFMFILRRMQEEYNDKRKDAYVFSDLEKSF